MALSLNEYPKISLVTPSYNQGEYIEKTITSIIEQNYPNLEYVIIDGGSTDNTLEVLKKYDKYLSYWVSEPDNGQSHALNKGIRQCTGDIFNWINSDDYYAPNALHKVAQHFANNPHVNVVTGMETVFYEDDRQKTTDYSGTRLNASLEELVYAAHIDQPPTFFRMGIIEQIGLLNEELHYRMDSELWMKYLLHYGKEGILKIPDKLTYFRVHDNSKTGSARLLFEAEYNALLYVFGKHFGVNPAIVSLIREKSKSLNLDQIQNFNYAQDFCANRFRAVYCRAFYPELYRRKRYRESREAFYYYLRYGKLRSKKKLVLDIFRVALFSYFRKPN